MDFLRRLLCSFKYWKKKSGQSILKSIFLKWRGIATLRDDLNFSALEYCVLARKKIYPPKMFWLTSNHQQPFHSSRIACSSYCFNGYLPNWNLLCGLQIQKKVLLVFACVDKPLFFFCETLCSWWAFIKHRILDNQPFTPKTQTHIWFKAHCTLGSL